MVSSVYSCVQQSSPVLCPAVQCCAVLCCAVLAVSAVSCAGAVVVRLGCRGRQLLAQHCALRPTPGIPAAAPTPQQLSPHFRPTQVLGWWLTKYQENFYFSLISQVWPERIGSLSLVLTRSAAARPAQHRAAPPAGAAQTPQQITKKNI